MYFTYRLMGLQPNSTSAKLLQLLKGASYHSNHGNIAHTKSSYQLKKLHYDRYQSLAGQYNELLSVRWPACVGEFVCLQKNYNNF